MKWGKSMKTILMDKMNNALQYLNTCLAERAELLRFMAVAVLTRRNLFILGLPGQAKSDAIRRFRSCFENMNFFGYQLTRETDEEKLFGRLDLASIVPGGVSNSVLKETPSYQSAVAELEQLYNMYETEQDDAKRSVMLARIKAAAGSVSTLREALSMLHSGRPSILTAGKIPQAHLVLLDEIFKANDNALNSLLTALNERIYTNEGEEIPIATISFFAASNEMPNLHNPEDKVYAPLLDRFDLKIVTEYIKDKSARQQILHDKISCSDVNHALEPITLDELHRMQQEVAEVEVPEAICDMMDDILCAISELPFQSDLSLRKGQTVIFSMRSHGIIQRNLSANIFPRESGSNLSVHSKLGTGKIVKEIGGLQRRLPCPASISLEIRKNPNRKELQPKAVAGRRSALVTLLRRHLSLTRSILIMKMVRIW